MVSAAEVESSNRIALDRPVLEALAEDLLLLRRGMLDYETRFAARVQEAAPPHRLSASNLLHYLALRHHDVRDLQVRLARVGASSLGRAEAHTLANLDRVLGLLGLALDKPELVDLPREGPVGIGEGDQLLTRQATELLGWGRPSRRVRIMVTMPTEAGEDLELVTNMVQAGMDCARINCAHDEPDIWRAMIRNIREASAQTGNDVRVLMDLAGPKLRTGNILQLPDNGRLSLGDRLLLVDPEHHVSDGDRGHWHAVAECPVPEVFRDVRCGDPIWFDDGKLGGVVEAVTGAGIDVQVTHAKAKGSKIKPEKGINLPLTSLSLSSMTEKDRGDLAFVAAHADAVSLSFVREEEDVTALFDLLDQLDAARLGVVLKIETGAGFQRLGGLLLTALQWPLVGIMIARGDLAVETGFERLAEEQEEALWLGQAAHVPTIWATQVLEGLAKGGIPSRAEITDAAASSRAEAVMLNKGPHILEAIRTLDDVLRRMQAHVRKNRQLLRPLRVSHLE